MPRKNYSSTGGFCRVTFSLPAEVTAEKVSICGDFNNWNPESNPLQKRKDGRWSTTLSLKSGKKYRFKYLIDGKVWENDWNAESYERNEHGSDDSVIHI